MQTFPYMTNPAKIRLFLDHIQTAKRPPKVTHKYLESAGFKSKNDRPLVTVMKFLGFLDSSGVPTNVWQHYRDPKRAKSVLAEAIRTGYGDLFGMYEAPFGKDDGTLQSYFSSKTEVGKSTVNYIALTFKTLCKLADFEAVPVKISSPEPTVTPTREEVAPKVKVAPSLQLNIEIHIAADTPDDKIKTIFKNMKEYLLPNE
jgi:hypothetical protein